MGMIDHFGLIAPLYNRIFSKQEKPACLQFLPAIPNMWVLDAGGGSGRISAWLEDKDVTVVIGDASFKMLRHAKAFDTLCKTCLVSEEICFLPESFEAVLMVDAFHHVSDQAKTLSELWRVVKPGGKIIIEEPNIHRWGVKLIALAEKLLLMRSHFVSPEKIAKLLQDFGANVEIQYDDHFTTAFILAIKDR